MSDTKDTLTNHLAALAELRNLAVKKGQYGAAVAAEVARGKAAGLYAGDVEDDLPTPTKVVVQVVDGRRPPEIPGQEG